MNKFVLVTSIGLALSVIVPDVHAQRGGRGGGGGRAGGGGGRAAGGGFSGGGGGSFSSPSPSFNRSPSMSRPGPSTNTPAPSMNRAPQGGLQNRSISGGNQLSNQPNAARPGNLGAANNLQRPSGVQAGQMNLGSSQAYQRPSQQNLGNFLNMPQPDGSGRAGTFSSGSSISASQLPSSSGSGNQKSFTTQGGATITVGGKSGSGTTSGGATVGGAAGGIKVETAGGGTYGKVGAVGGATDGTNSAVRGGSITGAKDAEGNKAANVRGGYADSSGYRQGGSVTARQNENGYASITAKGGYGYGNGTGQIGSVGAVRGPAGNVVSAGRGASFVGGQFVGGQTWGAVNGNYTRWNYFGPGYIANYPNAWWPGKWAVATTAWATATYAVAGSYCGCAQVPTYYDYGQNVTYSDGVVYQDDAPVASAEEYYDQAQQIAAEGQQTTNEEWMPLGVFAVVADGQTNADKVAQLALNKDGVIRGNLHDLLADQVIPISGSVDKETQRVALKLTGNDDFVVETGLYNLTNDEVPVLLHFGAGRQEARTLVRLQQPEDEGK